MRCKKCDEELEDGTEIEHLHDIHADLIDEALQEYMSDAENDVSNEIIE